MSKPDSSSQSESVFSKDAGTVREEELAGLGNLRRLMLYKGEAQAQSLHTTTAGEPDPSWMDGIRSLASSFLTLHLDLDHHDREKDLMRLSSALNTETGSFNDTLDVLAGTRRRSSFYKDQMKRDRYTAHVSSLLPDYHTIDESFGSPNRLKSCVEQCGEAFSEPLWIMSEGHDERTRRMADRVKDRWMKLSEFIADDTYEGFTSLRDRRISRSALSSESADIIDGRLLLVQRERERARGHAN